MLRKGKELRDIFRCSDRTYSKVRKIIVNNPERYGVYGVCGLVTDDRAFADALKYKTLFEKGYKLPPYRPEEASLLLRDTT